MINKKKMIKCKRRERFLTCINHINGIPKGKSSVREKSRGGRSQRTYSKNVMKCPCCPTDISGFLQNIQANTELLGLIESLKAEAAEENGKRSK
ncbi:hypothetical protein K1719_047151 [Acacia pycnantha]|nr:hypothetical protein K1719_047151 [Acacia pycnantha]